MARPIRRRGGLQDQDQDQDDDDDEDAKRSVNGMGPLGATVSTVVMNEMSRRARIQRILGAAEVKSFLADKKSICYAL